jgi:hypothetical protein
MPSVERAHRRSDRVHYRARVTRRGKSRSNRASTCWRSSATRWKRFGAPAGGAGVGISGVEVKTAYITEAPEAAIAELEKQSRNCKRPIESC